MSHDVILSSNMRKSMAHDNVRSAHNKAEEWLQAALLTAQDPATREAIEFALDEIREARKEFRALE